MMNKNKSFFKKLSLLVLSIVLTGCNLMSTQFESPVGEILKVDSNGHFTEDIIYNTLSRQSKYSKDGIFEITYYNIEGETKTVDSKYKGSYSWNPKTTILKQSYSEYYNGDTSTWEDNTYKKESGCVFFEHMNAETYLLKDDGSWVRDSKFLSENGFLWDHNTTTINIDLDKGLYNYFFEDLSYSSNDLDEFSKRAKYTAKIDGSYPENRSFSEGTNITLNLFETTVQEQTYNEVSKSWNSWTEQTRSNTSVTWYNYGDFIFNFYGHSERELNL